MGIRLSHLLIVFVVIAGLSTTIHGQGSRESSPRPANDRKSLLTGISNGDINTRVRSAIALWTNHADSHGEVLNAMEHDKSSEVRRRIAQVLAARYKEPRALPILRDTVREADISTSSGASAFLMAASSLHAATSEPVGIHEGLQILSAPTTWFQDVRGESFAYARKDAPRMLAASYLSTAMAPSDKQDMQKALRAYALDVSNRLEGSTGQERKFWEMRLPTVLDIAIRTGYSALADEFAGKAQSFENRYERERLERVVRKAKKAK